MFYENVLTADCVRRVVTPLKDLGRGHGRVRLDWPGRKTPIAKLRLGGLKLTVCYSGDLRVGG